MGTHINCCPRSCSGTNRRDKLTTRRLKKPTLNATGLLRLCTQLSEHSLDAVHWEVQCEQEGRQWVAMVQPTARWYARCVPPEAKVSTAVDSLVRQIDVQFSKGGAGSRTLSTTRSRDMLLKAMTASNCKTARSGASSGRVCNVKLECPMPAGPHNVNCMSPARQEMSSLSKAANVVPMSVLDVKPHMSGRNLRFRPVRAGDRCARARRS